ncbi:MAG: phosphoglycerate mutase family protein [Bacteroidota bacterium]
MQENLRRMFAIGVLFCCIPVFLPAAVPSVVEHTTVIVVRHAERDTQKVDPPISVAGRERAQVLAQMLAPAGISAIYTTDYLRTQQTVQPLASALRIRFEEVNAENRDLKEHVADLLKRISTNNAGRVVLVSSHSNVIPLILQDLGVEFKEDIPMHQYDDLFIVTKKSDGTASLLRLKFGRATPASASSAEP